MCDPWSPRPEGNVPRMTIQPPGSGRSPNRQRTSSTGGARAKGEERVVNPGGMGTRWKRSWGASAEEIHRKPLPSTQQPDCRSWQRDRVDTLAYAVARRPSKAVRAWFCPNRGHLCPRRQDELVTRNGVSEDAEQGRLQAHDPSFRTASASVGRGRWSKAGGTQCAW